MNLKFFTNRICLILSNDKCMSNHGNETVNVGAKVDLDHVTVGQDGVGLGFEGRVVADHIVYGYTCREGDS